VAPWSGRPTQPPAIAAVGAAAAHAAMTVYASWNGATEVASWRVLAGASPAALAPVATANKTAFQTTISAPSADPYVAVQALDGSGAVIGTSATIKD
jgi:hypothetical protein